MFSDTKLMWISFPFFFLWAFTFTFFLSSISNLSHSTGSFLFAFKLKQISSILTDLFNWDVLPSKSLTSRHYQTSEID